MITVYKCNDCGEEFEEPKKNDLQIQKNLSYIKIR